jgi:hypothetical protein
MNRTDIINRVIEKHAYKSFLEIGVHTGDNIRAVNCPLKVGVDGGMHFRAAETTYFMNSDDFFAINKQTFDCIFIDACHDAPFVCRDLNNSLNILNEGGTILLHDCFPPDSGHVSSAFCGDAFKVIRSVVKDYSEYLLCRVFDTDYGVGMIKKIKKSPVVIYDNGYAYETLRENPSREINLIPIDQLEEVI